LPQRQKRACFVHLRDNQFPGFRSIPNANLIHNATWCTLESTEFLCTAF